VDTDPWTKIAPTWVFLIASLAGLVGYLEGIDLADSWKVKLLKCFTRMASSALAAILTFHFIHASGLPEAWHIPMVGIGAHAGTEALRWMGQIYKKKLGITDTEPDK
jgi:hypothetical protein